MARAVHHLQATKRRLQKHGWCQGAYARPNGQTCLLGALKREALHLQAGSGRYAWRLLELELRKRGWDNGVAAWNDAPGRTVDEVIALLDDVIRKEK